MLIPRAIDFFTARCIRIYKLYT